MNMLNIAICVFLILFIVIQFIKPSFLYRQDGSLRDFGVGYRNKTIVPMWLVVLILSIFSYFGALCYSST
jgi:hypothetical protein